MNELDIQFLTDGEGRLKQYDKCGFHVRTFYLNKEQSTELQIAIDIADEDNVELDYTFQFYKIEEHAN